MKRLITIICTAIALGAIAQNSALFVYQKHGGLTPLLFSEVDSIRFSYLDIDSIEYNVPVTQEIWTPDSVYRIPVSEIDSVSFQTPPTVLKSRTIDLTKSPIRQYVIDATMKGMFVTLSGTTPASLIPAIGDYLAAMEYGGVFGCGFVGRVLSVASTADGVILNCEEADLTDVFDCYYGVFQSVGYNQENKELTAKKALRATRRNIDTNDDEIPVAGTSVFHLKPIRWAIPSTTLDLKMLSELEEIFSDLEKKGSLESENKFGIEGGISMELAPVVTISHMSIVRWNRFYQRTSIAQNDVLTIDGHLVGQIGKSLELSSSLNRVFPEIPLLYFVDIEAGGSLSINASFGWQQNIQAEAYRSFIMERNDPFTMGHASGQNGISRFQTHADVILDGSITAEIYITPMIKLLHKNLASLQAKFYGGLQLSGNFMFNYAAYDSSEQSSMLYSALKGKGWQLSPIGGFELTGQLFALSTKYVEFPIVPEKPWMSGLSVPNIDRITVTPKDGGKTEASITVKGNCITPHKIGIRVVKNAGEENETIYDWVDDDNRYWTSMDGSIYTHEFEIDINRQTDKVYPLVEYYGSMIVAKPSWPYEPRSDIFYPYTSYLSDESTRVISGASNINNGQSENLSAQEGNFLPFIYFTSSK